MLMRRDKADTVRYGSDLAPIRLDTERRWLHAETLQERYGTDAAPNGMDVGAIHNRCGPTPNGDKPTRDPYRSDTGPILPIQCRIDTILD